MGSEVSITVIGIFKVKDRLDFEDYRSKVGATIQLYGGTVVRRGSCDIPFWNQLNAQEFDTFVELTFPTIEDAKRWANSSEYGDLLPVRNCAMQLTLFVVTT